MAQFAFGQPDGRGADFAERASRMAKCEVSRPGGNGQRCPDMEPTNPAGRPLLDEQFGRQDRCERNDRCDESRTSHESSRHGVHRRKSGLAFEEVPASAHGLDTRRFRCVAFNLLTQPADVDINRARSAEEVIAPDFREDLLPCEDLRRVLHEE